MTKTAGHPTNFFRQWGSHFLSHPRGLRTLPYTLEEVERHLIIVSTQDFELEEILLEQIAGSVRPHPDFDRWFRPRTWRLRPIWNQMQQTWARGESLPPIDVVRVNETIFVRDGHLTVAQARAFHRPSVFARIEHWWAMPPLPWEPGWGVRPLQLT